MRKNERNIEKVKIIIVKKVYFFINILLEKLSEKPIIEDEDILIEKLKQKASLGRFGDGEFSIINGKSIGFQKYDEVLAARLKEILKNDNDKFLVGIPKVFGELGEYRAESIEFWSAYMTWNRRNINKLLRKKKIYYNSFITRPYMIYQSKVNSVKKFEKIKSIWSDEEIILVEGTQSNLGVGNDLFLKCKKVTRIKAKAENAFDEYERILKKVKSISKNKLVLISLGPTATVLAYDLFKEGFRAIDIGHIDIEYEWLKRGVDRKIKIPDKYTNEIESV